MTLFTSVEDSNRNSRYPSEWLPTKRVSTRIPLRCFVAMAFGHADTDKVYNRLIYPTLRKLDIRPIRVDRVEHLEEVNIKIKQELERCDFAVADLTYARPSVYFEAGFAERKVRVIYTSRRDHLSGKSDDKYGNFRVHFDLQMKNIVPWKNPTDPTFRQRFGNRVTYAVTPLRRAKQTRIKEEREFRKFAGISLLEKKRRILETCVKRIKQHGFRGMYTDNKTLNDHFRKNYTFLDERFVDRLGTPWPGWSGTKQERHEIRSMLVHVTWSLTKSEILELAKAVLPSPLYNVNPNGVLGSRTNLVECIIVCSIQKVPDARVQLNLAEFSAKEPKEFVWNTEQAIPRSRIKKFPEVYVFKLSGNISYLFVVNPRVDSQKYDCRNGRIYDREHGETEVGRLTNAQREIHIRIFDQIQSDKALDRELTNWLKQKDRPYA